VYTEGIGLAAAYIADHLKEWGVKPGGDHALGGTRPQLLPGCYACSGVRTKSNSSVDGHGERTVAHVQGR
jgi:hypothetical protein